MGVSDRREKQQHRCKPVKQKQEENTVASVTHIPYHIQTLFRYHCYSSPHPNPPPAFLIPNFDVVFFFCGPPFFLPPFLKLPLP